MGPAPATISSAKATRVPPKNRVPIRVDWHAELFECGFQIGTHLEEAGKRIQRHSGEDAERPRVEARFERGEGPSAHIWACETLQAAVSQ